MKLVFLFLEILIYKSVFADTTDKEVVTDVTGGLNSFSEEARSVVAIENTVEEQVKVDNSREEVSAKSDDNGRNFEVVADEVGTWIEWPRME